MNFAKFVVICFLLHIDTAESFHFVPYAPLENYSNINNALTVQARFKCFNIAVERRDIQHFTNFKALLHLQSSKSWIIMYFAYITSVPGIPRLPADDKLVLHTGTGIPTCYLSKSAGGGEILDPQYLKQEYEIGLNVHFDGNAYIQPIQFDTQSGTIMCATIGQTRHIEMVRGKNISDMEPLQFNAMLGFSNKNDNPLFIGLALANIPQWLAINVNERGQLPQISVGEKVPDLPIMNDFITLSVMQGQYRHWWAVSSLEITVEFPKSLGIIKPDPIYYPPKEQTQEDFFIFDTTNEYITAPYKFWEALKSKRIWSIHSDEYSQFLFEFKHTECDYAESLMPSIILHFADDGDNELSITLNGKFLLREGRNAEGFPICSHWLRGDEKEDHMWRLGLTFLRKVYVEMYFDPTNSVENRQEKVIIYKKEEM